MGFNEVVFLIVVFLLLGPVFPDIIGRPLKKRCYKLPENRFLADAIEEVIRLTTKDTLAREIDALETSLGNPGG